jgi:penicillin-binding protein 1C
LPEIPDRRVLDEAAAFVITDVLADRGARIASFGEGNVLELPFAAAAKTGTSKGFRDNWTVGYTPEVTVGVWVGNFDGSPMHGVSGITGAGPLFHDAMAAAMRGRQARGFVRPEGKVEEAEVCPLSGMRPTADCPHRRREIFVSGEGRATAPEAPCAMHVRLRIDKRNGLRAGNGCRADQVEERVFERFDATFAAWARSVGRSMAPESWSPLCPGAGAAAPGGPGRVRIAYPPDGARFALDPGTSSRQAIQVLVEVPAGVGEVRLVLDGRPRPLRAPFSISLPLAAGEHRIRAEAGGAGADEVGFTVE